MSTELDERTELIMLIDKLNPNDRHKLSIFLAGLKAGQEAHADKHSGKQNTAS